MGRLQHERTTTADVVRWFQLRQAASDETLAERWFRFRFPLALLCLSLIVISGIWFWLGTPVASLTPRLDQAKLDCVSYAPFRGTQDPLTPGLIVGEHQIAEDFHQLAGISHCVRTYSTGNGLDKAPALARQAGLKLLLGVWIGTQPLQNAQQLETAIALANQYPDVIDAIVVGNEVMLRREMTASELAGIVRSLKSRVAVPVTYADVWDVWPRLREISDAVDFLTIHILPYWDDVPVRAELAAAHVNSIRQRIAATFPGKEVFVGETGWPSAGRMREGARPSPANQRRVVSDVLALAAQQGFRVNLIEAYDQPWKRRWEGTVGGHWGLFDSDARALKYPADEVVRNYPRWRTQMCCGLVFCLLIFGVAFGAAQKSPWLPKRGPWLAIALIASVCGTLLGIAIESLTLHGFGIAGWTRSGLLLITAIAAPLICAHALMSGLRLPTFIEVLGVQGRSRPSGISFALGLALASTTLIASETALGLVFDPRYRDFAFAPLTMAVLPCLILASFSRSGMMGFRPVAEKVFAGFLAISATYIMFNEGYENWQSLWTCAAYLALATTLWLVRFPISHASDRPIDHEQRRLAGEDRRGAGGIG